MIKGRFYLTVIFILSLSILGLAQEPIAISGQIVDALNSEPLIAATVSVPNSTIGTICDENGKFDISIPKNIGSLTVSYVGYEEVSVSILKIKRDKIIRLKRADSYLDLITILAKPPITPLTQKVESVLDFSIEPNRIIRLTKVRNGGHHLKLTDFDGLQIDSYKLKDIKGIEGLTTSCLGTHFLLTEYHAYQIHMVDDKIAILHKDNRDRYDQYIANCLDANSQYFYLNAKKNYEQISEITGYHRYFEEQVNFGQISDDFNARNYKEEKHYLDFMDNKGEDNWINTTTSAGLESFYDYWEKAALLKYNFYHPVDFYLHAQEKSVFILDHEKHLLRKFTLNGKVVHQLPIQYSKERKWSKKIFKDAKTEKLYTYFNYSSGKMLFEIDLNVGMLVPRAEFELSFVDNFKIYDDTIFFTNSGIVQGQEARILKRMKF